MNYGSFESVFTCQDIDFTVRGLTAGELLDLEYLGIFDPLNPSTEIYISCAQIGVVDWSLDIDYHSDFIEYQEAFERESDGQRVVLADRTILDIGRFIFEKLTMVSQEEEDWIRGQIRFSDYIQERESRRKSYDCSLCLKTGAYKAKNCTLPNRIKESILGPEAKPKKQQEPSKATKGRKPRNLTKMSKMKKAKVNKPVTRSGSQMIGGFNFPACPVSWVPHRIKQTISLLYYCHTTQTSFWEGGLGSAPNKFFRMQQIVASEFNQIEREKFEKK